MTVGSRLNTRLTRLRVRHHLARRTVRVRLTLLYGGLFLLSGTALVGITYALFERATEYTKPALPLIPHTPAILDLERLPPTALTLPQLVQALPQLAYVQHQLAADQRALVLSAPGVQLTRHRLIPALPRLAQDQRQLAADQHQLERAVNQLAQAVHQMVRARSIEAAQRAADSHQLLVDSGIALAVVAVLALLAGWLVAGRLLRPIRTITRKAQRISSVSLDERLALDGPPDELKELGDTLDGLFGRLEAAFGAQRQFVANASHELRAPLTRQRALIQVTLSDPHATASSLRKAHERVLASEQHLEQMLDGLLTLTRGQAGIERREHVDLGTLAARAIHVRESQFAGGELDLRAALAEAPTTGDPRLLERLIANLIDNGIRHNIPGGHVQISTGVHNLHAFVSVANTGPMVPPNQIARLFEPFQRLGGRTRHSGHGLGLSIVRTIADAHQAELSARARPEGGLAVEVSFPPRISVAPDVTIAVSPRQMDARAIPETRVPAEG